MCKVSLMTLLLSLVTIYYIHLICGAYRAGTCFFAILVVLSSSSHLHFSTTPPKTIYLEVLNSKHDTHQ